jgi:adenylate cyclase, class 2
MINSDPHKEIEVKILDINPKEIRDKLQKLGARKIFDGQVKATTLDFEDNRLKKSGQMLRLRTMGDKIEFCFKGKNESPIFKCKEEIEVNTNHFEKTLDILNKIGINPVKNYQKHRESYQLNNVKFEIDTYENFPSFLEVEAPTQNEVEKFVLKLGYTMEQTTNLSMGELQKK